MAICFAILRWKHYLMGRHLVVRTDQQSLRFITRRREIGAEYQKWVRKLIGFDFEIQYKLGSSNRVADALSRKGGVLELGAMITTHGNEWPQIEAEVDKDEFLAGIKWWE